jgi:hypothetical protein
VILMDEGKTIMPSVAEGFVASGLSLDLLPIFHGMTCLPRQMVELY